MKTLNFVDRYNSTLASAYTSGGTSLAVASASGLPSGACYFFLIVKAENSNSEEVFLVTNVTGTTLTVAGAQAGTTASNHASGAAIIGSILTANALQNIYQNGLLSDNKPAGVKGSNKLEYQTLANNGQIDLLNISGSGPGYVDWMFLGVPAYGTLTITIDGTQTFNDVTARFMAADYSDSQPAHCGRWFQYNYGGSGTGVGLCTYIPIPFSSSIRIQYTNLSGGSATLFTHITYQTGVPNVWPYTRKLWANAGLLTNQTVNTVCTLLNATGLNPGRMLGLYLNLDAFPNTASPTTAMLEGNIKIYVDGNASPSVETPGTEDYFGMSAYFRRFGPVSVTSGSQGYDVSAAWGDIGCTVKTNQASPNTFAAYRLHLRDPILFNNALKVTWNCGDSSQVNFTGGVRVSSCVWYYTE